MIILGIDTSCDDTSAAVVEDGLHIRSNVISSQIPFHRKYGGVVPEIAARKHVELINVVIKESMESAGVSWKDLDAVAVDALLARQDEDGKWMDAICPEYGTAMACFILQMPNNYLPIIQR